MLRDGDENVVRRSEEDEEEAEVEAKVEVKAKRRGALEASSTCIVLWRVYEKNFSGVRETRFRGMAPFLHCHIVKSAA